MKPEDLKTGHTYVIIWHAKPEHVIFLEKCKGFLNRQGELRDAKGIYYNFYKLEHRHSSYLIAEEVHDYVRKL